MLKITDKAGKLLYILSDEASEPTKIEDVKPSEEKEEAKKKEDVDAIEEKKEEVVVKE
jgi:hypothetical protein